MKRYVHYGCGICAPDGWINFDSSPTLRIQKIPILGLLLKKKMTVVFPPNIYYGDIVKGLPIEGNSCDGIFCSHVLEHLSYEDFRKALQNTFHLLKPNGIFRLVMPNLKMLVDEYLANKIRGDPEASVKFMRDSGMALDKRPRSIIAVSRTIWGNSKHLYLWDQESTIFELKRVGFVNIRICEFNDCHDPMFRFVEDEERFKNALALEMTKS